jgi:hypothetical protein
MQTQTWSPNQIRVTAIIIASSSNKVQGTKDNGEGEGVWHLAQSPQGTLHQANAEVEVQVQHGSKRSLFLICETPWEAGAHLGSFSLEHVRKLANGGCLPAPIHTHHQNDPRLSVPQLKPLCSSCWGQHADHPSLQLCPKPCCVLHLPLQYALLHCFYQLTGCCCPKVCRLSRPPTQ